MLILSQTVWKLFFLVKHQCMWMNNVMNWTAWCFFFMLRALSAFTFTFLYLLFTDLRPYCLSMNHKSLSLCVIIILLLSIMSKIPFRFPVYLFVFIFRKGCVLGFWNTGGTGRETEMVYEVLVFICAAYLRAFIFTMPQQNICSHVTVCECVVYSVALRPG